MASGVWTVARERNANTIGGKIADGERKNGDWAMTWEGLRLHACRGSR